MYKTFEVNKTYVLEHVHVHVYTCTYINYIDGLLVDRETFFKKFFLKKNRVAFYKVLKFFLILFFI